VANSVDKSSSESINNGIKFKEGGSILEILEEMITVCQTMGFSMEGCTKDMEKIIETQGEQILDRVGEVSYRLALPPQLSYVYNVFHVSLLRGYKYHPLHVISYPLDQIRADLSYVKEPEAILDRQDRVMRNKTIPFVKIFWRNHPERDATWETEESIRTSYPHFLL
nr:hypothetical protein [Tanacetum cinerariifolium]